MRWLWGGASSQEKSFSTAESEHVTACHAIMISCAMKGKPWAQAREGRWRTRSKGKTRSKLSDDEEVNRVFPTTRREVSSYTEVQNTAACTAFHFILYLI